jgi:hypothetical protein
MDNPMKLKTKKNKTKIQHDMLGVRVILDSSRNTQINEL